MKYALSILPALLLLIVCMVVYEVAAPRLPFGNALADKRIYRDTTKPLALFSNYGAMLVAGFLYYGISAMVHWMKDKERPRFSWKVAAMLCGVVVLCMLLDLFLHNALHDLRIEFSPYEAERRIFILQTLLIIFIAPTVVLSLLSPLVIDYRKPPLSAWICTAATGLLLYVLYVSRRLPIDTFMHVGLAGSTMVIGLIGCGMSIVSRHRRKQLQAQEIAVEEVES